MRGVIIGNGRINDYDHIRSLITDEDFVICADGGIRHAKALGIKPDAVIGDFDSGEEPDHNEVNVIKYPTDKPYTDGELAMKYAHDNGFDEIMLLGMTGDRLDHTLSNIFNMAHYPGSYLIDDKNEVRIVKDRLIIEGKKGKTFSFLPVCGELQGITLKGFRWELDNEDQPFGLTRGISNIITSDHAEMTIKSGIAIVVINDGE